MGEFEAAHETIRGELKQLASSQNLNRADRRLLVSSLDVNIGRMEYDTAERSVETLKGMFQSSMLDTSDRLLLVRTLAASARIMYLRDRFRDAISEWGEVISLAKNDNVLDGGMCIAVCQISLALAHMKRIKQPDQSVTFRDLRFTDGRPLFSKGMSILKSQMISDHSLPTVANHWVPLVIHEISSSQPDWIEGWMREWIAKHWGGGPYAPH
jgi:hypothetical protein